MLLTHCRLVAIAVVCAVLALGCTGLQVKRGVDGNTLYSSSRPRLNVVAGAGFKFMDEEKDSASQFFAHSDGSTNIEREIYRFWNDAKICEIQVQFHRIARQNAFWSRFDFKDAPHLIEAGEAQINEDTYQYGVYPVKTPAGCFLVKVIGRRIGAQSNTKMVLYYAQRVGAEHVFSQWKQKSRFNAEQNKRLQDFLEAFKADVRILDYAGPAS